jgi:hypothetical protein
MELPVMARAACFELVRARVRVLIDIGQRGIEDEA